MPCNSRRRPSRRRGVGTLELILVLPIIVVILVAIFEFTMIMVIQSAVSHSATVGAREAGKEATIDELAEIVQAMVGVNCVTISDLPGSGTKIALENGDDATIWYGDPAMTCTLPTNAIASDEVRVTVCVALDSTAICNSLGSMGFSILGRQLKASSVVKREQ